MSAVWPELPYKNRGGSRSLSPRRAPRRAGAAAELDQEGTDSIAAQEKPAAALREHDQVAGRLGGWLLGRMPGDNRLGTEHQGWMQQKLDAGWQLGSERDDVAKTHPSMIPYEDLSEEEKEKDRSAVRNYPEMVRQAGMAIVA